MTGLGYADDSTGCSWRFMIRRGHETFLVCMQGRPSLMPRRLYATPSDAYDTAA
jgi:hypothetical protein